MTLLNIRLDSKVIPNILNKIILGNLNQTYKQDYEESLTSMKYLKA